MSTFDALPARVPSPEWLPPETLEKLPAFGRFAFDPAGSGEDGHEMHRTVVAPLKPYARKAPEALVSELHRVAQPLGGWALYGAARLATELVGTDCDHADYRELIRGSLQFLREGGVPSAMLAGHEWAFWLEGEGRRQPWLRGQPRPSREEAPVTDLDHGERRLVARVDPAPDSDTISVRRHRDGGYAAVIEGGRGGSGEHRPADEWLTAESLEDLYWEIGTAYEVPTHWCEDELRPYFPLPEPTILGWRNRKTADGPPEPDNHPPPTYGRTPPNGRHTPPDTSSGPGPDAGWHERAEYFIENDNPAAAHRVAQEGVTHSPGDADGWRLRGQASALLGNYRDAEYELGEAARLDPSDAFAVHLLGEVYAAQEQWERAMARLDEAIAIGGDHPWTHELRAKVYLAVDRPEDALQIMEQATATSSHEELLDTLAVAIHDTAISRLTPTGDGYLWTEEHHLAALDAAAARIEKLRGRSPLRSKLSRSLRDHADEGRTLHWDTSAPNLFLWLGGLLFLMSCGACVSVTESVGVGLITGLVVGGGAAGTLFVMLRHKPAWQIAKEQLGKGNLSYQLISAGNRARAAVFRFLDP
jgi:tetratricopeptide (TPR) repeat protein